MATGVQAEGLECPECGGKMELEKSWTRKSMPLIGSEIEVGEFICQDCGVGRQYERKDSSEEWS